MSIFNNIRLTCRYFYQKRSRFPQTVEVAIGVDCFDLVALAEREADLGLFAEMQFLTLIALFGVEGHPLDVVLRQHGMLHGADRDFLDGLVTKVYEFGNQKVTEHLCGIYEFLEKKKMDSLQELEKK